MVSWEKAAVLTTFILWNSDFLLRTRGFPSLWLLYVHSQAFDFWFSAVFFLSCRVFYRFDSSVRILRRSVFGFLPCFSSVAAFFIVLTFLYAFFDIRIKLFTVFWFTAIFPSLWLLYVHSQAFDFWFSAVFFLSCRVFYRFDSSVRILRRSH